MVVPSCFSMKPRATMFWAAAVLMPTFQMLSAWAMAIIITAEKRLFSGTPKAEMMKTGLDKRIALFVLSKIGARTNRILAGVILVGFILSFFVPSTTARVSCMVPIVMGIISAFGVPLKSRFSAVMMIAIAQADSIWNVGIKTAAAQNMVALGFIEKQLGTTISWLDWFIAAAPFAVIMSVVLYFLLLKLVPPEMKEIPGGQETVARALRELGPMTASEKKLMALSVILLFLWSTEKVLHSFDTSTTTSGLRFIT